MVDLKKIKVIREDLKEQLTDKDHMLKTIKQNLGKMSGFQRKMAKNAIKHFRKKKAKSGASQEELQEFDEMLEIL